MLTTDMAGHGSGSFRKNMRVAYPIASAFRRIDERKVCVHDESLDCNIAMNNVYSALRPTSFPEAHVL